MKEFNFGRAAMAIWIHPPRIFKPELKHAHLIRDPASYDAFLYDTEKNFTNCKGSDPIYTSSKRCVSCNL